MVYTENPILHRTAMQELDKMYFVNTANSCMPRSMDTYLERVLIANKWQVLPISFLHSCSLHTDLRVYQMEMSHCNHSSSLLVLLTSVTERKRFHINARKKLRPNFSKVASTKNQWMFYPLNLSSATFSQPMHE